MSAATNGHIRKIQRLGVYPSIDRDGEQLAKLAAVHVSRGQDCFLRVLSRPGVVIVIRGDVHLRLEHCGENADQGDSGDAGMANAYSLHLICS